WGPGGNDNERLAVADELVHAAAGTGDNAVLLQGLDLRLAALLTLGDGAAAARDANEFARRAARMREPLYLWLADVFLATQFQLRGEVDAGERAAGRALAQGERVRPQTAEQYHATLMWALRRDQRRSL